MRNVKLIFFFLFASGSSLAQSDSSSTKFSDIVKLNGYVKNMQIFSFADDLSDINNDNLLHNRLNFSFYPHKNIRGSFEIRNRIFTGESVDANPDYAKFVDEDNGLVDLSFVLIDEPSLVFLTQIDRLWAEWSKGSWEVRAGRQRINWGINLFWNSNDLFNAYSLVDFDYEERPGNDAIRIRKYFKDQSGIDLAFAPGNTVDGRILAARYTFNYKRYDIQFIGGSWKNDLAFGTGWAGNLGKTGFKGEVTYFIPQEKNDADKNVLSASISSDYIFKNQVFLTFGALYNSGGVDTTFTIEENLFVKPLSAKNLMPTSYSGILSVAYPISPLFSGSLTGIFVPGVNTAFIMPSLSYSMAANWQLALFGQSFWIETDEFRNIGNGVFVRVKGSF